MGLLRELFDVVDKVKKCLDASINVKQEILRHSVNIVFLCVVMSFREKLILYAVFCVI